MSDTLSSHFSNLTSSNRTQKVHITDTNATPILSTNSQSPQLTALSQALVTSNSAVEHLGLGRIRGVQAHYVNGEVVQSAKLNGKTGVIATISGKELRRSLEVEKIVDVIHGALEGNEETTDAESVQSRENGEERSKSDERREQWETLGGS